MVCRTRPVGLNVVTRVCHEAVAEVTGQRVAVKVTGVTPRALKARGDPANYNLYCKVSKSKTTATKSAGYGQGYRICK